VVIYLWISITEYTLINSLDFVNGASVWKYAETWLALPRINYRKKIYYKDSAIKCYDVIIIYEHHEHILWFRKIKKKYDYHGLLKFYRKTVVSATGRKLETTVV